MSRTYIISMTKRTTHSSSADRFSLSCWLQISHCTSDEVRIRAQIRRMRGKCVIGSAGEIIGRRSADSREPVVTVLLTGIQGQGRSTISSLTAHQHLSDAISSSIAINNSGEKTWW
jgi:hypothetical protein